MGVAAFFGIVSAKKGMKLIKDNIAVLKK